MKRTLCRASVIATLFLAAMGIVWLIFLSAFPRPYLSAVEQSGISPSLVYALIRTESGYREDAVSSAGAVGLMQIRPSTAEFICSREGMEFDAQRLKEGEYNIQIGTKYLHYLLSRFTEETALAAYNAGEGTVRGWLKDPLCSADGAALDSIPYPETAAYVKKIEKFRKIYEILYRY